MKLTRAQMRYMLTIYKLPSGGKNVRSSDIAKALGFARPSVSRMLRVLSELELLEKSRFTKITFTETGRAAAEALQQSAEGLGIRLREALDLSPEAAEDCALLLLSELQDRAG